MSNANTRRFVLLIFIVFIILFFHIRNKPYYSFSFVFRPENIRSTPLIKLNTRQGIMNPSDNSQIFVFPDESSLVRLYLDVVRDTVCGLTLRTQEKSVDTSVEAKKRPLNVDQRIRGEDWPSIGITMVGQKRLVNIEWALRFVIANNVPGDFIECGVWRGGGSVFARAVLKALNIQDRHVWLVDSFEGLPKARTKNDDDSWTKFEYLKISLEEVQTNFRSFFLLDDQVHFCKGYFVDALPRCKISQIAVLRMDGDMYESTMDQFFNLYAKVQVGGVIIVDDYTIVPCNKAVHDFRNWHNITEEIRGIPGDGMGRYWIKRKIVEVQMERYQLLLGSTTKSPS